MKVSKQRKAIGLGNAGSLPAVLGSLPSTWCGDINGGGGTDWRGSRLPPRAGWPPALPRKR
jgi:hypothetical protein